MARRRSRVRARGQYPAGVGLDRLGDPHDDDVGVARDRAGESSVESEQRSIECFRKRDVRSVVARQIRSQLPCPRDERPRLVQVEGERQEEIERLADSLAGREPCPFDAPQKRAHLEVDVTRGVEERVRLFDPAGDDPSARRP